MRDHELELIAASLVSGAMTQADWQFLINHRFRRETRASASDRARAHRTTRRLTKLIGRAAA